MLSREWKYLLLIIIIFIAACIETDIYLPAFTDMMDYFSVSEETIQSLLTWNFIGICISGLLYGPISDALGRKKPLMLALGLFLAGSIMTVFADSFELMLVGRALQGFGSGGCFTLGTAIIFDAFRQEQAIIALNKINTIVPFIMAAAPMVGGYLNAEYGFRSNFLAIAVCVLLSLVACLIFFDETLPEEKRTPLNMGRVYGDFKMVVLSIPFWQTTGIVCLLFAGYLSFLSTISVLFVLEMGVAKSTLPFYQAALLGAWLVGNLSFNRANARLGSLVVKKVGTILILLGGIFFVLSVWVEPASALLPTVAMVIYSFGVNWVMTLYFPEGMALFPDAKGMAASILTSARLLVASVVVALAGSLYNGTIYPIAAVIFGIVISVLAIIAFYESKKSEVGLESS